MSIPKQYWWWLGLLAALFISALIRVPRFGQVPVGLNRDEAGLGYNAYSLWRTGKDEYNQAWPISITSFGDQKLPGYVYTLLPFVGLGGLNPTTIRLPSLLAGWAVIMGVGIVTRLLKNPFDHWQPAFSITTMLLVAISPWGNHFSRVAYEANLAMAFLVWGLVTYHAALAETDRQTQRWWWWLTSALWSLCLLTYHSYHILIPVLGLALVWIDRKNLQKSDRMGLAGGLVIGLLTIVLMWSGHVWQANQQKSVGISPFNRLSLQRGATVYRQALPQLAGLPVKIFANTLTESATRVGNNFASVVSGDFFWVRGTPQTDHNPGGLANHHLFTAPFFILGALTLWEFRKLATSQRLSAWLLASVVAPSLTIQPQHTTRFSPAFAVMEIIAAIGVCRVLYKLKQRHWQLLCAAGLSLIALWSVGRLMTQYLAIIPATQTNHGQYHLLARTIARVAPESKEVIVQSPSSSPYVWYLVENQLDPRVYNTRIERYPKDQENFQHVKRIDNISFETIQWENLAARSQLQPLTLIFLPKETPGEWRKRSGMHLLESITDDKGEVVYEIWKMERVK